MIYVDISSNFVDNLIWHSFIYVNVVDFSNDSYSSFKALWRLFLKYRVIISIYIFLNSSLPKITSKFSLTALSDNTLVIWFPFYNILATYSKS